MTQIQNIWQMNILSMNVGDILTATIIFLLFLLLRGVFSKSILALAKPITARTHTKLDDKILAILYAPLRFLCLILGLFFAIQSLALEGLADEISDNTVKTLLIIALFRTFYAALAPIAHEFAQLKNKISSEIIAWITRILRALIVLTAIAAVLEIWGIQVLPIIAGLGLFGVAIALGAQDLFKNLLAGITILVEQRFRVGDIIKVPNIAEGSVEQIGFRSTKLRQYDKTPITVPNNFFADNAVINITAMLNYRIYWMISLEYKTTTAQLKTIQANILDWIRQNTDFISDEATPPYVYVNGFNDNSIDLIVYCFTHTAKWAKWLELKHEFSLAIKEIVETADAGFAFPTRSIYVETLPAEIVTKDVQ